MSKKNTSDEVEQPTEEQELTEEAADETTPGPDPEPEPAPQPEPQVVAQPTRKGSGAVAWLALFLSLAALGSIGYSLVQEWRAEREAAESSNTMASSIAALRGQSDENAAALANLENGISALESGNSRTAAEIAALQSALEGRISLLDSLPPRMAAVENSLATLQGVSTGARNTWLLAEAEYYMQIANAQLQLAGNPYLAALALGMADERIVQLADPALTEVRRMISDELTALEVMDKPDIEGVSLTLASLASVVRSLPLNQLDGDDSVDEAVVEEQASGVTRAWNSVKGAVSGLVRVTPPDQATMPLIAPDSVYFLRTNLTLQLQTARLALLRGEKAVFEQSLDDATTWLNDYFDVDSAQVSSALQTIAEIRNGLFTVTPPDISQSLRLLRQYKVLAESKP